LTITVRDLDDCLSIGAGKKQADDRVWLVEQRYRAVLEVLEVLDGSPVSEMSGPVRVPRQSLYSWKARYMPLTRWVSPIPS